MVLVSLQMAPHVKKVPILCEKSLKIVIFRTMNMRSHSFSNNGSKWIATFSAWMDKEKLDLIYFQFKWKLLTTSSSAWLLFVSSNFLKSKMWQSSKIKSELICAGISFKSNSLDVMSITPMKSFSVFISNTVASATICKREEIKYF